MHSTNVLLSSKWAVDLNKVQATIRPKKPRNGTCAKGGLFQTLSEKILQLFSSLTSLAVGDVLWNSAPDSRRQFSHCFWSAFLVFRKMRFRTESAKTYHPKHTPERSSFWPYGQIRPGEHIDSLQGHGLQLSTSSAWSVVSRFIQDDVKLAQLVRARECQSQLCRFDSGKSPKTPELKSTWIWTT